MCWSLILWAFCSAMSNYTYQQESPPAGNRKRRTARGITCPSVTGLGGGYPSPTWGIPQSCLGGTSVLTRGGTPVLAGGTLSWPGWEGYPILTWPGVPHPYLAGGTPTWDWSTPVLGKHMGPEDVLWDGDGVWVSSTQLLPQHKLYQLRILLHGTTVPNDT